MFKVNKFPIRMSDYETLNHSKWLSDGVSKIDINLNYLNAKDKI